MTAHDRSVTWRWYTVGLLWIAGICAAMQFAKMSIGLRALQDALETDATSISALMAATGLFGLIFGVSGAAISNAIGLRRVLLYSLFAAAALSLLEALIPPFFSFYAFRLLEGVTNLFIVVAAPTLIAAYAPPRQVAMAMALWGSFYGVAFALTGLAGPALILSFGATGLLAAHGFLALTIGLVLSIHRLPAGIRMEGANDPGSIQRMLANQIDAVISAYRNSRTSLPGLIFFFHSSLYLGFLIFVPLSAQNQTLTDVLLVTMPLASIVATLAAGPLSQVLPVSVILIVGFLLEIGLAALLVSAAAPGAGDVGYGFLAHGLMVVSGVLQGSIFILVPKLALDSRDEALAFGVIAQLGSLGSIIGPMAFASSIAHGALLGFAVLVAIGAIAGSLLSFMAVRQRYPQIGSTRKSSSNS